MRKKIKNALAVLTSLFGYLEWGGGNSMFLFQGEWEVLRRLATDPLSAAHPFTLIPLLGQVLLIATLFQKEPSRWLTYAGLACIGLLLLMVTFIGVIGLNYKMLFSTLPFIVAATFAIMELRKK